MSGKYVMHVPEESVTPALARLYATLDEMGFTEDGFENLGDGRFRITGLAGAARVTVEYSP